MSDALTTSVFVSELAERWRCRPATIRKMLREGVLDGIVIGGRVRITPESIARAEGMTLAVVPAKRQRQVRDVIPPDIRAVLDKAAEGGDGW